MTQHKHDFLVDGDSTMEMEIITLGKVPTKVLCFGGITPSAMIKPNAKKPKELILIIPGNPGVVEFYANFANRLYDETGLPVWVISHGGHGDVPCPSLAKHPEFYDLTAMINQKEELISVYLSGVKLRCIGHSIGAKMILSVMKDEQIASQIGSAFMLFPTIEKMATSDSGRVVTLLLHYFYWPILVGLYFLDNMSQIVKKVLVYLYVLSERAPLSTVKVFNKMSDCHVIRRIIHLADDEMKTVVERDDEVIRKNIQKLRFYYSLKDGWTPQECIEDIQTTFPTLQVEIDSRGITHSFVLKRSYDMAEICADWLAKEK